MGEKKDSCSSKMAQFWLSLIATTISIALTFGVAAIIDHYKKKSEQREIVMMVMYDMYTSLQSVERADQMIRESMEMQCQFAEDTTLFEKGRFKFPLLLPRIEYTKSVENIFNSSIETILTVSNVLFAEDVAAFFQARENYKTIICDSLFEEFAQNGIIYDLRSCIEYDYHMPALLSSALLEDMRMRFASCQRMVGVSDEELGAYIDRRKEFGTYDSTAASNDSLKNELEELQRRKQEAVRALGW